jgi:small subunit ribosomal protein S21
MQQDSHRADRFGILGWTTDAIPVVLCVMQPRLDDYIACADLVCFTSFQTKGYQLQVFVRDNNVEQALRVLKKKMQREGVFREMKRRRFYEKPSERAAREKNEGLRRSRKAARKKAIYDGSIAAPRKKPGFDANGKPKPVARERKY